MRKVIGIIIAVVLVATSLVFSLVPHQTQAVELPTLRTANTKTYSLGSNQYKLTTSVDYMHYKDGNGTWQDINTTFSEPDTGNFTTKFSKLYYAVSINNDGTRRLYPDRNDKTYWIDIGKPFPNMGTPTKTGNTWTWDFAHAAIQVQMGGSELKFTAILKDAQAPNSITIPFSATGITRTGSNLYHNGKIVAQLANPTAVDSNQTQRDVAATFNGSSVTLSVNTTGLVYPIYVDPTVNVQVNATNDDVTVYLAFNGDLGVYEWLFDPNKAEGDVGQIDTTYIQLGTGLRFTNITIPQGSTINSANMTFKSYFTRGGTTVNSVIVGHDTDNASTFSTLADYQARRGIIVGGASNANLTAANVSWNSIGTWTENSDYTSPDISTIVQEIVNRAGWASGNAMALFWDDHAGASTLGAYRQYQQEAGYPSGAPTRAKLDITYTSGAAPTPVDDTQIIWIMSMLRLVDKVYLN